MYARNATAIELKQGAINLLENQHLLQLNVETAIQQTLKMLILKKEGLKEGDEILQRNKVL